MRVTNWPNFVMYDVESHIAEIYDQSETYTDDVDLIRSLIAPKGFLRILEPFCGTGRILIPLALDGHELVGLDQASGMLARAQAKVDELAAVVQKRISLLKADVISDEWPHGFDLVVLGGNCFYELATAQEQEQCIAAAARVLNSGGYLYVDNNHMEGELEASWRQPGVRQAFPTGVCDDGTRVESKTEVIWYDAPKRLVQFRRSTRVTLPGGQGVEKEYVQQKHPVSTSEVESWLNAHGFVIEQLYGDRSGNPYTATAERAIFWARKNNS